MSEKGQGTSARYGDRVPGQNDSAVHPDQGRQPVDLLLEPAVHGFQAEPDLRRLLLVAGKPGTYREGPITSHELQEGPDSTNIDADKLKGEVGYRLRVGPYRIIYTRHLDQFIIEVVKIRTRGDIYKR